MLQGRRGGHGGAAGCVRRERHRRLEAGGDHQAVSDIVGVEPSVL